MTKDGKTEDDGGIASCNDAQPSRAAVEIARGTRRYLTRLGHACLTEFSLPNGQRADITAVTRTGKIVIVEIKSCFADFRTDQKWAGYRDYCDELYFAVKPDFPTAVLPQDAGLILADEYDAAITRPAPQIALSAARRKALVLRFARASAWRLSALLDPALPCEPCSGDR